MYVSTCAALSSAVAVSAAIAHRHIGTEVKNKMTRVAHLTLPFLICIGAYYNKTPPQLLPFAKEILKKTPSYLAGYAVTGCVVTALDDVLRKSRLTEEIKNRISKLAIPLLICIGAYYYHQKCVQLSSESTETLNTTPSWFLGCIGIGGGVSALGDGESALDH